MIPLYMLNKKNQPPPVSQIAYRRWFDSALEEANL